MELMVGGDFCSTKRKARVATYKATMQDPI